MKRTASWLAALVVLLSNAGTLGRAWVNRSAGPEATLTLTEREVRLAPRERDNTAVSLGLVWVDPARRPERGTWFDAGRLAALGFDCRAPVTRDNGGFYLGQAPRTAYAALEFEGEAWTRYLASFDDVQDREAAAQGSHLVLIDVDRDPAALRARHPDRRRIAIVHVGTAARLAGPAGKPPALVGRVTTVYPSEVNVPRGLRPGLDRFASSPAPAFEGHHRAEAGALAAEPRFSVVVSWGRSFEPWIESIDVPAGDAGRRER